MTGISPSTTWTCLSKFKCSVWSFVVEVPAKCDDQVAQKPSLQPPTSARDPCATCCKRTSTTNEIFTCCTWRSITSGTVRSSPKCSSWLFVVEVPVFSHNKWRKGPVEPKCRHTGTKLPSGSGSTSGGAFRSSQNLGSGGTCDTKHAVSHSNRHNDSLIKVNAPGPRPGSQSRRT